MKLHRRALLAFFSAWFLPLPFVEPAANSINCGDDPCSLPLPEPCTHYVEKSYRFSGSCCSLSTSGNGCLLTVADGDCEYTAGEPGVELDCETPSGDIVNCFQHEHDPLENVCRDWQNETRIFNTTEFVSCDAVPSHTETTLVSASNETCPEAEFELRANTTWEPSEPSIPSADTIETQAASNAATIHLLAFAASLVVAVSAILF